MGTTATDPATQRNDSVSKESRHLFYLCSKASLLMEAPMNLHISNTILDLAGKTRGEKYRTLLADPPWRFINRTGKVAPEHRRLTRYETMSTDDICSMPVSGMAEKTAHLYLWVPNALLPEGLKV